MEAAGPEVAAASWLSQVASDCCMVLSVCCCMTLVLLHAESELVHVESCVVAVGRSRADAEHVKRRNARQGAGTTMHAALGAHHTSVPALQQQPPSFTPIPPAHLIRASVEGGGERRHLAL